VGVNGVNRRRASNYPMCAFNICRLACGMRGQRQQVYTARMAARSQRHRATGDARRNSVASWVAYRHVNRADAPYP